MEKDDGGPAALWDDDCEDQGMVATDVCLQWPCNRAPLILRGPFWCCPACGGSYGEHAKEGLTEHAKGTGGAE